MTPSFLFSDDLINVDNDVMTTDVFSDAEIVEVVSTSTHPTVTVQDEESSDDEVTEPDPPTHNEGIKALQTLRRYCESRSGLEKDIRYLSRLAERLEVDRLNQSRQTCLTEHWSFNTGH